MSKSILDQISKALYKTARTTRDVKAFTSGKPMVMAKRGGNKVIGRLMGKMWLR